MTQSRHHMLNRRATIASVCVALVLVAAKLWAFGTSGALSVAASLADSVLDMMVSLGGLAAVIYAARPPDEDHAFGHSSAEDLAALGQSTFILLSAGTIGAVAVGRMLDGSGSPELAGEGPAMVVMGLSIVLTVALVAYQTRIARQTGNRVVLADRLHYLGDLLPNLGAIAALWASASFGLTQLDNVIALGAAGMLTVGSLRIGAEAWDALMDRAVDPELIRGIEEIAGNAPGVHGFHDLKTRRSGSRVFVNIHIELDGGQTLDEAHAIGAELHRALLRRYPQCDIIIHKDPVRDAGNPDRGR